jgi:hypothetical protein
VRKVLDETVAATTTPAGAGGDEVKVNSYGQNTSNGICDGSHDRFKRGDAAACGVLVSPVRQALQSVKLTSPESQQYGGGAGAGSYLDMPLPPSQPADENGKAQKQGQIKFPTRLVTSAAKKQARSAAMQAAALAQQAAKGLAPSSSAPAGAPPEAPPATTQTSLQDRAANFLAFALEKLLGSCPFLLPASVAFTYSKVVI